MNLVLSEVEEAVHIVDVTEDGQAMPVRVSSCRYLKDKS